MPYHLPKSIIAGIETALTENHATPKFIAQIFNTMPKSIYYIRRRMVAIKAVGYDIQRKPGRKAIISWPIAEAIGELLASNPDLY